MKCAACQGRLDYERLSAKHRSPYLREKVGDGKVLLALSGGVDILCSRCACWLRQWAQQLTCVFVDHGLMRKNEGDEVEAAFAEMGHQLHPRRRRDAASWTNLQGVTEPERKRKIIGEEFIRVFEEEAQEDRCGGLSWCRAPSTPTLSNPARATAAVIKSHHNVGGLPDYVDFKEIIEPLRLLFKDEVRQLGRELGLPDYLVMRQPFPGPGLAIRVLGRGHARKSSTPCAMPTPFSARRCANAGLDNSVEPVFRRPDEYAFRGCPWATAALMTILWPCVPSPPLTS